MLRPVVLAGLVVVGLSAILLYLLPLTGWLVAVREVAMGVALLLTLATGIDYVARAQRLRAAARVAA